MKKLRLKRSAIRNRFNYSAPKYSGSFFHRGIKWRVNERESPDMGIRSSRSYFSNRLHQYFV